MLILLRSLETVSNVVCKHQTLIFYQVFKIFMVFISIYLFVNYFALYVTLKLNGIPRLKSLTQINKMNDILSFYLRHFNILYFRKMKKSELIAKFYQISEIFHNKFSWEEWHIGYSLWVIGSHKVRLE